VRVSVARKKAASGGGPGSGDWLNTYADMVTLLLTFFILLFSMSRMDAEKFNLMVEAFASAGRSSDVLTIEGVATEQSEYSGHDIDMNAQSGEITDIVAAIKAAIQAQNLQDSVSVSQVGNDVFIRFMDDMLFEPNSAVLRPSDRELLQFVGDSIKSVENKARMIAVHGHTAAIPGNPDYEVNDWQLSSARADTVVNFFEQSVGIDPIKMQALTWGKNKPFTSNETEEGRSKNRRIEIHISTDNPIADQLDNIYENLVP
jgi:chemotaxis protein MotB